MGICRFLTHYIVLAQVAVNVPSFAAFIARSAYCRLLTHCACAGCYECANFRYVFRNIRTSQEADHTCTEIGRPGESVCSDLIVLPSAPRLSVTSSLCALVCSSDVKLHTSSSFHAAVLSLFWQGPDVKSHTGPFYPCLQSSLCSGTAQA